MTRTVFFPLPTLLILTLSILVMGPVSAQVPMAHFHTVLDEGQVVPPSGSFSTGDGELTLDLETRRITYRIITTCVGPIPVLQFGLGEAGEPGSVLFELNQGVYDMYEGTTPPLTNAQISTLFREGMYVAISTSFPFPGAVEIRGQLKPTVRKRYRAALDATQVVPPTGSAATGQAWIQVLQPENTLFVDVELEGVEGTAARLHQGAPGDNGPVLTDLTGSGGRFCGLVGPLSESDLASVLNGESYFLVESDAFPAGEIRGQLMPAPSWQLVAEMNGAGMVPPLATPASGLARFELDTDTNMLSYEIEVLGMTATRLELGAGFPGEGTLQSVRRPGGPDTWSGQVGPLNANAVDLLLKQGIHVLVRSDAFPAGEIRGQIVTNPYFYGFGSDSGAGRLRSGHRNHHVAGNPEWTATLSGAPPGERVLLFVGNGNVDFRGDAIPLDLDVGRGLARSYLWIDPSNPRRFSAIVDETGCASVVIPVPDGPGALGVVGYYQWIVREGTTPSELSVSDAMKVIIQ